MIVISGALVLVAAVLLVLGIVSSITLVYAAIGLSLVSAVFLLVGVFQRPVPAAERVASDEDAPTRAAPVRVTKPKQPESVEPVEPEPEPVVAEHVDEFAEVDTAADYPLEAANADFEQRAEATGADVLVISGRPRYHVGGCEYVEGHDESEPLVIVEARELGFTPCGVCRPNETLARSASGRDEAASSATQVTPPAPVVTAPATVAVPAVHSPGSNGGPPAAANGDHPAAPATAEQPAAVAAAPASEPLASAASPAVAPAPTPPPVAEPLAAPPVVSEPVVEVEPAAPAKAARAPRKRASRAKKPPVEASAQTELDPAAEAAPPAEVAAPAVAAPDAAPTKAAAPARARVASRTVQAVAVTKEYHRSGCVLLDGVEADELTKAAAIRQGFLACGVCKP